MGRSHEAQRHSREVTVSNGPRLEVRGLSSPAITQICHRDVPIALFPYLSYKSGLNNQNLNTECVQRMQNEGLHATGPKTVYGGSNGRATDFLLSPLLHHRSDPS